MTSNRYQPQEAFTQAVDNWQLERLYTDLEKAKQEVASYRKKCLTDTEKLHLQGLLCGLSPCEIAESLHKSSRGVEAELSKTLYRYVEILTKRSPNSLENWRDVIAWLKDAGYQRVQLGAKCQQSWSYAPDVSIFYGRSEEIATLETWINQEKCRLVAILGMPGIGKTTVAVKLAQNLQSEFDFIIWRSLSATPSISEILTDLLTFLSNDRQVNFFTIEAGILQLLEYLKKYRCLIVLDNIETILQPGELAGKFSPQHQPYQDLIKCLAAANHHSCLVVTTRETIRDIDIIAGPASPIRIFQLAGLNEIATQSILQDKGIKLQNSVKKLFQIYRGNPLAVKIISTTIQDIFDGSIDDFLQQSSLFIGDFSEILSQQLQRLSNLEKELLYGLALEVDPVKISSWKKYLWSNVPSSDFIQAIASLNHRSLLEKNTNNNYTYFTLQPVVMKYTTTQLIEKITQELLQNLKNQIHETNNLINKPLLQQFQQKCPSKNKLEKYCLIYNKVEQKLLHFFKERNIACSQEKLKQLLALLPHPKTLPPESHLLNQNQNFIIFDTN